jgi:hypothetical protein
MLEVVAEQVLLKMMNAGNAGSLVIGQVIAMAVVAVVASVVVVKEDLIVVATEEEVTHQEEVDHLVEVAVIVVIAAVEMTDAQKNLERVFALSAEKKVI